jgi:hypothetical protein
MMSQQEQDEFLSELNQFTGTENYYKFSILFKQQLTDGIKFLCEKLKCYWLMDIVGSVSHLKAIQENESFILWKFKKIGKGFNIKAYSDFNKDDENFNKEHLLYSQDGLYTDFPLNEFEFYECNKIILLKSEY